MSSTSEQYKIIIDTEQYSGNFERGMCAFITGSVGECEVGSHLLDYTDDIIDKEWWEDNIDTVNIEGYDRICYIYPTPNWWNDGYGNHYPTTKKTGQKKSYPAYLSVAIFVSSIPPENIINDIIKRAKEFCENYGKYVKLYGSIDRSTIEPLTFTGIRILKEVTTVTEEVVYEHKMNS